MNGSRSSRRWTPARSRPAGARRWPSCKRSTRTRSRPVMTQDIGNRQEWEAARRSLLEREKELTRASDALAQERMALPWVPVETEYTFDTEDGPKTPAELFDGRS